MAATARLSAGARCAGLASLTVDDSPRATGGSDDQASKQSVESAAACASGNASAPRAVRYLALWVAVTATLVVLTRAQSPVSYRDHGGSAAGVSCTNSPSHDTAALLAAINRAPSGGTVHIAAGTCALTSNLPVHSSMTIDGAGRLATFLVQHARTNIFQITAPGVPVENVNLNTATYNRGSGRPGSPEPAVLFSAQSHTMIRDVSAEAGSGYGMRITGSSPCDGYHTTGRPSIPSRSATPARRLRGPGY